VSAAAVLIILTARRFGPGPVADEIAAAADLGEVFQRADHGREVEGGVERTAKKPLPANDCAGCVLLQLFASTHAQLPEQKSRQLRPRHLHANRNDDSLQTRSIDAISDSDPA
jgi:hypothetical protein